MKPKGHESIHVNGRKTFWCLLPLNLLVKLVRVHYHLDNSQAESFDAKL